MLLLASSCPIDWRSRNDDRVSLVMITILNGLNHCEGWLRHMSSILSSFMFMMIDERDKSIIIFSNIVVDGILLLKCYSILDEVEDSQ